MARANRHSVPGQVVHLTHRCHNQQWLLQYSQDRNRWTHWLYQARCRYGLSVLNYVVTSNHVHLLVKDMGQGEVAKSMQLIAGRTAQEHNRRKHRRGAFWEDRYQATVIESDTHLARCLVYIDMNMVRAGAVSHPVQWQHGGYAEIQKPLARACRTDVDTLLSLLRITELSELQKLRREWVEESLKTSQLSREPIWTESVAIGSREYLSIIKKKNVGRKIIPKDDEGDSFVLAEASGFYSVDNGHKIDPVRPFFFTASNDRKSAKTAS